MLVMSSYRACLQEPACLKLACREQHAFSLPACTTGTGLRMSKAHWFTRGPFLTCHQPSRVASLQAQSTTSVWRVSVLAFGSTLACFGQGRCFQMLTGKHVCRQTPGRSALTHPCLTCSKLTCCRQGAARVRGGAQARAGPAPRGLGAPGGLDDADAHQCPDGAD